jgi:hypothetical protein
VHLCFVLAIADKKSFVLDVERHVEEAQELVSVTVTRTVKFKILSLVNVKITVSSGVKPTFYRNCLPDYKVSYSKRQYSLL